MRDRDLRLTDISLMVGFTDQSYFTKVFKRLTGTLPRAYREKCWMNEIPPPGSLCGCRAGVCF